MRRVLVVAIALSAVAGIVRAGDKTYPEISHEELVAAVQARTVTLIDNNGTDSYKDGHIPTALNFEDVQKNLASVLPRDKSALIVAYCSDEDCSAYREACEAVEELGYINVKHYAKGIIGWKRSGAKVETVN
jgi:rhodanese-related sulfurtransferase